MGNFDIAAKQDCDARMDGYLGVALGWITDEEVFGWITHEEVFGWIT